MAFPAGAQPGIDVSHYQEVVDWPTVHSAGDVFGFAKASEGQFTTDQYFADNWAGMKAVGVLRGAYHFYHPSKDAQAQVALFLKCLATGNGGSPLLAPGDLPAALDLEITENVAPADILAGVATWLAAVQAATGRQPLLYTYPSFWKSSLGNPATLAEYPLWIAHLKTAAPTIPGGWGNWAFWQFDKQPVDGVTATPVVDLDAFNGSLGDLQKLAGQ